MAKQTNREKILTALLETASIREAAQTCGISEPTIYRQLQEAEFLAGYRAARRQVVESSIAQLQAASVEAVEALRRNLHSESPAIEIRAAQIILDNSFKGLETTDILERLETIENEHKKQIEASGNGNAANKRR